MHAHDMPFGKHAQAVFRVGRYFSAPSDNSPGTYPIPAIRGYECIATEQLRLSRVVRRKSNDAWLSGAIAPCVIRPALYHCISCFKHHLFRIEHQRDFAFDDQAKIERAGLLHVRMRRVGPVGGCLRRPHTRKERLHFAGADLAAKAIIGRESNDTAYRAARWRFQCVGAIQRLTYARDARWRAISNPYACRHVTRSGWIGAHIG